MAVGVVLLPELARALKGGHLREAGNLQNRSIEFVLFLTIPAAFALWILSDEIIRVLYERGAFHQQNTAIVGSILAIYGIGLPAFVLIKALQPGFYAREDTKTPMRFSAVAVAVNCAIALTLFRVWARPASPLPRRRRAGSAPCCCSGRCCVAATSPGNGRWRAAPPFSSFRRRSWAGRSCTCSTAGSHRSRPAPRLLTKVGTLGLLIAIAMVVYFATAFLIGGANLGMIRRNLNRKPAIKTDSYFRRSTFSSTPIAVSGRCRHERCRCNSGRCRRCPARRAAIATIVRSDTPGIRISAAAQLRCCECDRPRMRPEARSDQRAAACLSGDIG